MYMMPHHDWQATAEVARRLTAGAGSKISHSEKKFLKTAER